MHVAGDHLVAEPDDDLGEQFEPVPLLVCDQDAQVLDLSSPAIALKLSAQQTETRCPRTVALGLARWLRVGNHR